MVNEVKYYKDIRNIFPAREFINDRHNGSIKVNIQVTIGALEINGLDLMKTERMSFIGDRDDNGPRIQGLYELRSEKKKWRVAVYHDQTNNTFVLLCGWRKNQWRQPEDILRAQTMQREYLSRKEKGDVVTD